MRNAIHPQYPISAVKSVDDLMDIAAAMEHEAAVRYRELAARMEDIGESEMAALFRDLAAVESEHEAGIVRWAAREGRRAPRPISYDWQMPETFAGSSADGEARLLTPYRALGTAVRNEERAFAFYSYLAALADDRAVQDRAETLAHEELRHVAQLRVLRRRAYHEQCRGSTRRRAVDGLDDLRGVAFGLEKATAEVDAAAAFALEAAGLPGAGIVRRIATEDAARARELSVAVRGKPPRGTWVAETARLDGSLRPDGRNPAGALRLALRNAEAVFEEYLLLAERAADAAVMSEAQRLGEVAVARLAILRSHLARVEL